MKVNKKIYTRTRQHLRLRREGNTAEQSDNCGTQPLLDADDHFETKETLDQDAPVAKDQSISLDKTPRSGFKMKSQTTRSGGVTKVPQRFQE